MDATAGFCQDLIRSEGFAILVTADESGATVATHLPVSFDGSRGPHGSLFVEVAWGTAPFRHLAAGHPVVALFHGPPWRVTPDRVDERAGDIWSSVTVRASGTAHLVDEYSSPIDGSFVASFEIPLERLEAHVRETVPTRSGPARSTPIAAATDVDSPSEDLWGAVAALMSLPAPGRL